MGKDSKDTKLNTLTEKRGSVTERKDRKGQNSRN